MGWGISRLQLNLTSLLKTRGLFLAPLLYIIHEIKILQCNRPFNLFCYGFQFEHAAVWVDVLTLLTRCAVMIEKCISFCLSFCVLHFQAWETAPGPIELLYHPWCFANRKTSCSVHNQSRTGWNHSNVRSRSFLFVRLRSLLKNLSGQPSKQVKQSTKYFFRWNTGQSETLCTGYGKQLNFFSPRPKIWRAYYT